MKMGVIGGAGLLGSTTAFFAGTKGVLEEIKLLDVKDNMVMSHVMDMDQALFSLSGSTITKAEYPDLNDCDIILITASLPERNVGNRNEYLQNNLSLVKGVCDNLSSHVDMAEKIVINASNPVDVFNFVAWKLLGTKPEKTLGFCINDSVRFAWAISKTLGVPFKDVAARCIGEHGEGQVPLFGEVTVKGEKYAFSDSERAHITGLVADWFKDYQALNSGRTSGWTSAAGLTRMITAIATDSGESIQCSLILDGELGQRGLSIGVPCFLGKDGVKGLDLPDMEKSEQDAFASAGDKIRSLIASVGF